MQNFNAKAQRGKGAGKIRRRILTQRRKDAKAQRREEEKAR
jgi:hypothetical protein